MTRLSLVCSLLLTGVFTHVLFGQSLPVDVLQGKKDGQFVKIAFFAEGYTESERAVYENDVQRMLDTFFTITPFREYRNFFAVFRVWTPSEKSGVTEEPSDSTFFGGSARSCSGCLSFANFQKLMSIFPDTSMFGRDGLRIDADIAVLIFNHDYPAGVSDGVVESISRACNGHTLAHETGHVLGDLADEYVAHSSATVTERANVTQETDPEKIKWKFWIDPDIPIPTPQTDEYADVVGLFEGANYHAEGWFRPKVSCEMNIGEAPFCEVCREALVSKMYQKAAAYTLLNGTWIRTALVSSFTPPGRTSAPKIEIGYPDCSMLKTVWYRNGDSVAADIQVLDLTEFSDSCTISVIVKDNSGFIKNPKMTLFSADTLTWIHIPANASVSGMRGNPFDGGVRQTGRKPFYSRYHENLSSVILYDCTGRRVKVTNTRADRGGPVSDLRTVLKPGIYILRRGTGERVLVIQ